MTSAERQEIPIQHRPEEPALRLHPYVAVCLHYVEQPEEPPASPFKYPKCTVFRSMELDLMSYAYQTHPVLGSKCHTSKRADVEVEFPAEIDYWTEGRHMRLQSSRTLCHAQAMVSSTLFLHSGVRIWHVVLVPAKNEVFNEFDIIKLIHLYDGRTEDTTLKDKAVFRLVGESQADNVPALHLLGKLLPEHTDRPSDKLSLKAGTVQILTGQTTAGGPDLSKLIDDVLAVRDGEGQAVRNRLLNWLGEADSAGECTSPQGRALLALCGIVTGIFDFNKIGSEETLDTLDPTFASPGSLIRVHRCTIVSLCQNDRAMRQVWERIGISPYLLLPHAVLLHNEAMADQAIKLADDLRGKRTNIGRKEKVRARMERNLQSLRVPNVFNYITERTLYRLGSAGRGTDQRLASAKGRLIEVENLVKSGWQARQELLQLLIALFMLDFAILAAQAPIFECLKSLALEPHQWKVLLGLMILPAVVIIAAWRWTRRH